MPTSSLLCRALGLPALLLLIACDTPSPPEATSIETNAVAVQRSRGNWHWRNSGPFAHVESYTEEGDVIHFFAVWVDSYASGDNVSLYYYMMDCDQYGPNCWIAMDGAGSIPRKNITWRAGTTHLVTNTSPSVNPDFDIYAGSGGLIDITWTKVPFYTSRASYHSRTDYYADVLIQQHGNYSSSSAFAQGSMIGVHVAGEADVGTALDAETYILKK